MSNWWNVTSDDERRQWTLDPFVRVGPLRFGMSPGEVSAAMSGVTAESQRHRFHRPANENVAAIVRGDYRDFGLRLYYREERLSGVAVDALCGPQVRADGVALIGRVPSDVERWMVERAEERAEARVPCGAHLPGRGSAGVGDAECCRRCAASR